MCASAAHSVGSAALRLASDEKILVQIEKVAVLTALTPNVSDPPINVLRRELILAAHLIGLVRGRGSFTTIQIKITLSISAAYCVSVEDGHIRALCKGGAGVAVSEDIINEVFAAAWDAAVHRNPILLARLQTDATIVRARQRIEALLAQGCSLSECRDRIITELLDPRSDLYHEVH
jgi:hypothetical protein